MCLHNNEPEGEEEKKKTDSRAALLYLTSFYLEKRLVRVLHSFLQSQKNKISNQTKSQTVLCVFFSILKVKKIKRKLFLFPSSIGSLSHLFVELLDRRLVVRQTICSIIISHRRVALASSSSRTKKRTNTECGWHTARLISYAYYGDVGTSSHSPQLPIVRLGITKRERVRFSFVSFTHHDTPGR